MRLGEREEVEASLRGMGVEDLHVYDAGAEYFEALKGVYEPEAKRKIIGNLFLDIQANVSEDLNLNPDEWILGQGTIYPDTIETGGTKHAHTIKTHHNRVEKIQKLIDEGKVIEPLSQLYKDEVRSLGEKLGLKHEMVWRHPFPGPGLAVRCLCAEGEDYPEGVKDLETRMEAAISESGYKVKVLPIKSVGVQGDERTYRHPAVIYGQGKSWDELSKLSTQLTNQFHEVNRVLLGLSPSDFASLAIQDSYLSPERILINQKADKVVMDFIYANGMDREIWQFPTVLIPLIVGAENSCESIVLRPVCSTEAMTANFYHMEFSKLDELVAQLKSVEGVGAVFYDITNKPPATIEWE
jgi:GMP synthase (glutamine-hydrolysing)